MLRLVGTTILCWARVVSTMGRPGGLSRLLSFSEMGQQISISHVTERACTVDDHPGGQFKPRPPRTWACTWKHRPAQSYPVLKTTR